MDTTYTLPLDSTFILPTATPNDMTLAGQLEGRLGGQENYGLEDFFSDNSSDDEASPKKRGAGMGKEAQFGPDGPERHVPGAGI